MIPSSSATTTASPTPTDQATPPIGGPVPDLAASLTIVVRSTGTDAGAKTYTLTCAPTGGDVKNPQAACDQLNQLGQEAFAEPPQDTMCTQQYGGPQTATITGTLGGEPVNANFKATDGCQISRWQSLSELLGAAGS